MEASDGVEVRQRDEVEVIGIEHTGPYEGIGEAFGRLHEWLGEHQLAGDATAMYAIFLSDPRGTPSEELKSMAAVSMSPMPEAGPPAVRSTVAGGSYAVITHEGPYESILNSYRALEQWFNENGRQFGDRPAFEVYLNTPEDTAPEDLRTEIHFALAD